MPELPEVETIKEDLNGLVAGAGIERVETPAPDLVEQPSLQEFERRLAGTSISGASRRGKSLILELSSGDALTLQLKIGGQLLLVPPVEEPDTALMLILHLDGDRKLFLRDETGYTRANLLDVAELEDRFSGLGPEPLENGFDAAYLMETLGGRRAQVKPLLLDQKVVAGVGNIYVDESLFDARVHPRRKANTLSVAEWDALTRAIRENIASGIEHRGTTFSLYRDVLGRKGHHQEHLRVFMRQGKPCPGDCGERVVKDKVSGRATYLCPSCQVEDGPGGDRTLELE